MRSATQQLFGQVNVVLQLFLECSGIFKADDAAQASHQIDSDRLTIEIPLEAQQMDFDLPILVAKRRIGSDVDR